jgi:hypothetical protein
MSAFFQYEVVPNSTESNKKKRVPVQVSTLYVYVCVCVFTLGLVLSLVTIGGFILAAIGLVLFLGGLMVCRL